MDGSSGFPDMGEETTGPVAPSDGAGHASWARRHGRRLTAGALLLVVVAGASVAAWERHHPDVFPPAGGFAIGMTRGAVGRTEYVGLVFPDVEAEGSIRIDHVDARVVSDSTAAAVVFLVCQIRGDDNGGVGLAGRAQLDRDCASVVPAEGATLRLDPHPRQQLVVAVTPHRSGRLRMDGVDITYSHGWRTGSQVTGGEFRLKVRER